MSQVGDYDVANASGASVRSDLNFILGAIKTSNSGSNDPSNPEAFMFYGDSGDNKLKIYDGSQFRPIGEVNKDNLGLLPRSGGTTAPMTGQFLADSGGTASAPAIAFGDGSNSANNDPDTGMFRQGPDSIGFACGGLERFKINGDGIHILGNNNNARVISMLDANNDRTINIKSPDVLANNYNLTLPPSIVSGGFLSTDGNGQLSFQIIAGVPTGAVFCMADNQSTATGYQSNGIPDGYLECSGQTVSRTTFSALFAVIGTRYGAGNGSTTFQVPDLRGEFVRGFDNGRGADSGRSIGTSQTQDNRVHSHAATSTSSTTQSVHAHAYNISHVTTASVQARSIGTSDLRMCLIDITNQNFLTVATQSQNANIGAIGTTTTIANDGSESRPRNVAMFYIIKV